MATRSGRVSQQYRRKPALCKPAFPSGKTGAAPARRIFFQGLTAAFYRRGGQDAGCRVCAGRPDDVSPQTGALFFMNF
jgi:hypothetical protein